MKKDRCIDCLKEYHPKNDLCRKCEFEESKWYFINKIAETKTGKLIIRFSVWLSKILERIDNHRRERNTRDWNYDDEDFFNHNKPK